MRLALLLTAAVLTGCATGVPVTDPSIRVTDAAGVSGCKYLDTVVGTSSWYGMHAERGQENARRYAFENARKVGATHVVWESGLVAGQGSTNVTAKAYACK